MGYVGLNGVLVFKLDVLQARHEDTREKASLCSAILSIVSCRGHAVFGSSGIDATLWFTVR